MYEEIKEFLKNGYTPYQTCEIAAEMLEKHGFKRVSLGELKAEKGGKYYLVEGGTLAAYTVNKPSGIMIAASHTDSPALKIKGGKTLGETVKRLNCEVYGGAVNYSFFDIPLKICGKIYTENGKAVNGRSVVSDFHVHIPSLAVHQNRGVNSGFAPSVQSDMLPLAGADGDFLSALSDGKKVVDFDLYACPDIAPFSSGMHDEYLCSPRIDNLTSVYSSLKALTETSPKGINIAICFNSEETGSRTYSAAGGALLNTLLDGICRAAGGTFDDLRDRTFLLSVDNAHAAHPSHPEKSDPCNEVPLGGGIVIKRNPNYATDGLSAAALKMIIGDVPHRTFFSHSDMPCGGTIGLIAAANTVTHACDIGIAQLAMHSATETCAYRDLDSMTDALRAFFSRSVRFDGDNAEIG